MTTAPPEYLDVHDRPGVAIIRVLAHEIRHPGPAREFGRELYALVERDGRNRLLLDFARTEYLGSTAFGVLATLLRKVRAVGGRLAICGLHPTVRLGLNISRLDSVLEIFDNERSALATF